jgi:hypothetical protein
MTTKEQVWTYECSSCYASYEPTERPEDGRCNKCDDAPNLREKQSEFGAGVVVCIAKFSEHLWTTQEQVLASLIAHKNTGRELNADAQRDLNARPGGHNMNLKTWGLVASYISAIVIANLLTANKAPLMFDMARPALGRPSPGARSSSAPRSSCATACSSRSAARRPTQRSPSRSGSTSR